MKFCAKGRQRRTKVCKISGQWEGRRASRVLPDKVMNLVCATSGSLFSREKPHCKVESWGRSCVLETRRTIWCPRLSMWDHTPRPEV